MTCNTALSACKGEWRMALAFELRNVISYSCALSACAGWQKALKLLDSMEEVRPNATRCKWQIFTRLNRIRYTVYNYIYI